MKFPLLTIQNFLAITKAELILSDRGLCLIQGVNSDDTSANSNGAGKSTIPDAICWCLYGVTARGVSGDDVVNDKAGKETLVATEVEDGVDRYRITRHRKHKTGKNALFVVKLETSISGATVEHSLTKGTDKLTQEVVEKIIGSSYEVFKSSIYAGQEQMPDLPAMTDKNLKALLEEASGATVLEAAYTEARQRVLKTKENVALVEQKIASVTRSVTTIDDSVTQMRRHKEDWDLNHKKRLDAAKIELKTWIDDINALKSTASSEAADALQQEVDACAAKIAASAGERTRLDDFQKTVLSARVALQSAERVLQDKQSAKKAGEVELSKVQHKIGCPCDSCGRPLTTNELESATKAVTKKISDCDLEITTATDNVNKAQIDLDTALKAMTSFAATMTDVTEVSTLQNKTQQELTALKSKQAVLKTKTDHAKAHGETVKLIAQEQNPHSASIAEFEARISLLKAEILKLENDLVAAEYDLEVDTAVAAVYSPSGARAIILDEITPELNAQTAKYLSCLSDGNIDATWTTLVRNSKGELREKFSIEVVNQKGAKSFGGLSGGEKRKVRLATALALQDLVATRAIKPIDLFIGDEIDDALDPAGLERLTQILEEKAKDRGSVFVISHNDLQDSISNIITVEKLSGGGTKITETVA